MEFERLDRLWCDDVVLYITFVALFIDGKSFAEVTMDVGAGGA